MEFISRRELDHVMKEVRRLTNFLTETFGSKFINFERIDDEIMELEHGFTGMRNNSSKSTSITNQEAGVVVERNKDPLDDQINNDSVIVVSTRSLNIDKTLDTLSREANIASIVLTDNGSVSNIPAVTSASRNNYGSEEALKESLDNLFGRDSSQTGSQPQSALITTKGPSQHKTYPTPFHLRGRSLFHRPSCVTNKKSKEIDSPSVDTPPTVGVSSMDGNQIPCKRSRAITLPSFRSRNRSLTLQLQPTLTSGKVTTELPNSTNGKNMNPEIIQCDLCSLFVYSSQLDNHMKNHSLVDSKSSEKPTAPVLSKTKICPICSLECCDYAMYEQHCSDSHPNGGFPCPICSRNMSSKPKLRRHMTIHRNLKFECNICGKAYNRSDNLNAHYKTHPSNETCTIFHCNTCTMAFASRIGRNKHVAIAHPDINSSLSDNSQDEESETLPASHCEAILEPGSEKVKVENSLNDPEIEFVYEGDDDDD